MITAVVSLAVVAVALAATIVLVVRQLAVERESWVAERRSLVDRVIATHVGEVIALDRGARKEPRPEHDRPQPVGL